MVPTAARRMTPMDHGSGQPYGGVYAQANVPAAAGNHYPLYPGFGPPGATFRYSPAPSPYLPGSLRALTLAAVS